MTTGRNGVVRCSMAAPQRRRTCRVAGETENVLWRTKLPSWSAATPIIWGDTVFVTSAEAGFQSTETVKGVLDDPVRGGPPSPLEKILLFAVNRQDGSVRWQQVVGMGNKVV